MRATNFRSAREMPELKKKADRVNVRQFIAAAGIVGALIATSACSASQAAAPAGASSEAGSSSKTAAPSASVAAVTFPYTLPSGLVAKGVANDGKGVYLQTSVADTDPAMKYNPAITDAAAKAHYSVAELAEAQKAAVRFIAEEFIDSTLNGGSDVDGWYAAHKGEIHPLNQSSMLSDLKSKNDILARERWMATRSGYSYVHGATTPRVTSRTITPTKFYYVQSSNLQGVMLNTTAAYGMAVANGSHKSVQSTTAEISVAVAKDPSDGKWKIGGYHAEYHTLPG